MMSLITCRDPAIYK